MRYNILVGFILFKNKQFVWNKQGRSGKPGIFCVTNTVEVSRNPYSISRLLPGASSESLSRRIRDGSDTDSRHRAWLDELDPW